jgi:ribosome biogenesis GTPase / thiamine phosphate phosphatase
MSPPKVNPYANAISTTCHRLQPFPDHLICRGERLARAGASPTRSGPEGSSRNEPHLGRCQPLTLFARQRWMPVEATALGQRMRDSLENLGWSGWFQTQLTDVDHDLIPLRVAEVHRTRMAALGIDGPVDIVAPHMDSAAFAVGDWVLVNPAMTVQRRLERSSLLDRLTSARDGTGAATQLIAANVDTLFITTSCNADFNVARLERYLAMAAGAGTMPVVILTKADGTTDPEDYRQQTLALQRGLDVITLDARSPDVAVELAQWCRTGQTVALVGSSGVGKSTLTQTLTGDELETGEIRKGDGRGRHTTTHRALRPLTNGGWIIDTPGMRGLQPNAPEGIDIVFDEITTLIGHCKFRDCAHESEPGCAVQAAINAGTLDPDRLIRWRKLKREERVTSTASATAHQRRFGGGGSGKKKR